MNSEVIWFDLILPSSCTTWTASCLKLIGCFPLSSVGWISHPSCETFYSSASSLHFTLVVSISLNSPPLSFTLHTLITFPSIWSKTNVCVFAILAVRQQFCYIRGFPSCYTEKKVKMCCVITSSHNHSYPDCITSTKRCYYVYITDSRLWWRLETVCISG